VDLDRRPAPVAAGATGARAGPNCGWFELETRGALQPQPLDWLQDQLSGCASVSTP